MNELGWVGQIRIACAEMVGIYWITPQLHRFFARYPGLRVDLLVDLNRANLSRQDADIAVRFAPPAADEEGDYIAHNLGSMTLATYCATSQWTTETDWHQSPCVSWPQEWQHLDMAECLRQALPDFSPRLTSNCYAIQHHGARYGLGLTVLPCIVGDADPQLVRITQAPQLVRQMWLVYHRDLRNSSRIMAMREFLLTIFAEIMARQ